MQYFLLIDEKQQGPYGKPQILDMLLRGTITKQTFCSPEGADDWNRVGAINGLLDELSPPPATPAVTTTPAAPAAPFTFPDLLGEYLNQTIGLNWKEPKKYNPAKLIGVTEAFFSVFISEGGLTVHYPYHQIVHLIEAEGGISTGIIFKNHFPVLVETMQLIVYSGAVGVSISI